MSDVKLIRCPYCKDGLRGRKQGERFVCPTCDGNAEFPERRALSPAAEAMRRALRKIARGEVEDFDEETQGAVTVAMSGDEAAEIARAALSAAEAYAAPPGDWVLVPREPTLAMQKAYFAVIDKNIDRVSTDARFGRFDSHKEAYAAMLTAAPQTPAAPAEEE